MLDGTVQEAASADAKPKDAFEARHLRNVGAPVSLPLTHSTPEDEVSHWFARFPLRHQRALMLTSLLALWGTPQ